MVLAHFGDVRTEDELCTLLNTVPTGTRAGNLMRLSSPAFEIHLRPSNLVELEAELAVNRPPIIFLTTGSLQYWNMDMFHTVVLVGLDATTAAVNDPYFATAPQTTSLPSFEEAWAQAGQFTAFLRPRQKP